MFIDILGDGESGFLIRGDQFAKAQKRNSHDYIGKTAGRIPILNIFRQQNVDELKAHLAEMKTLLDGQKKSIE